MHILSFDRKPDFTAAMTQEEMMEQVMKDYGNEVLYLCYTYVKEWNLAEDLAQDVFLKVYEKADTFKGEAKLKTWLYKIAANHCKDYIKSAHHRYSMVTHKIQMYIKGTSSSVEEITVYRDEKNMLYRHIFKLPLKYREVIFLYYYEELTLQEISDTLNANLSTIKSRLTKARLLLKDAIKGGK
ncbi:sigma-70 family RNA polymerase sigma factor [Fictibacillus sp. S7]|nr:sigma-70 family RNA polymerase sigma factor [Fictibacillus sp. S7]RXY99976.1 RNA polymerase factor sigma C [Fictibacillus sp. S7]